MTLQALAGVLLLTPVLAVQTGSPQTRPDPPAGAALIVGRVVDRDTERPVAGAAVVLRGAPTQRFSKLTDDDGRFVFDRLPPGEFSLTAEKPGFVDSELGALRPGGDGHPVRLADGQGVRDLEIPIWRLAVISGTVVDEAGEPLINARVHALAADYAGGTRHFQTPSRYTAQTDDRGTFRIAALPPGEYVVGVMTTSAVAPLSAIEARGSLRSALGEQMSFASAPISKPGTSVSQNLAGGLVLDLSDTVVASGDASAVYASTFFPAESVVDRASVIALGSGEERTGVSIALVPVPASRVSGRLIGPDGPAGGIAVRLLPLDATIDPAIPRATTVTDVAGTFTLAGVPAGDYRLSVLRIPRVERAPATSAIRTGAGSSSLMIMGTPETSPDPTWWAEHRLSVGAADLEDLEITLATGQRIRGRVEFDGEAPERSPSTSVTVETIDGTRLGEDAADSRASVQRDGTFVTPEFPPTRVVIRASTNGEWHVTSVTAAGRDVRIQPMDLGATPPPEVVVRLSRNESRLSGQVRSPDGASTNDAMVYVFPADRGRWSNLGRTPPHLQSARVDRAGTFSISGLPPGEYLAVAVADDLGGRWRLADALETLARLASPVTIGDSGQHTVGLTIARVR